MLSIFRCWFGAKAFKYYYFLNALAFILVYLIYSRLTNTNAQSKMMTDFYMVWHVANNVQNYKLKIVKAA